MTFSFDRLLEIPEPNELGNAVLGSLPAMQRRRNTSANGSIKPENPRDVHLSLCGNHKNKLLRQISRSEAVLRQ